MKKLFGYLFDNVVWLFIFILSAVLVLFEGRVFSSILPEKFALVVAFLLFFANAVFLNFIYQRVMSIWRDK